MKEQEDIHITTMEWLSEEATKRRRNFELAKTPQEREKAAELLKEIRSRMARECNEVEKLLKD